MQTPLSFQSDAFKFLTRAINTSITLIGFTHLHKTIKTCKISPKPWNRIEYERFFVQIDNKIGPVKLNIHSRYKLKETKEVYKLNKSSKLFKLKVKKRKKKYRSKCFSRKIIRNHDKLRQESKIFCFPPWRLIRPTIHVWLWDGKKKKQHWITEMNY